MRYCRMWGGVGSGVTTGVYGSLQTVAALCKWLSFLRTEAKPQHTGRTRGLAADQASQKPFPAKKDKKVFVLPQPQENEAPRVLPCSNGRAVSRVFATRRVQGKAPHAFAPDDQPCQRGGRRKEPRQSMTAPQTSGYLMNPPLRRA
ncbi:hypothetical protein SKAU_G00340500 [Synaphobranchus kaupii]|uniref:Uncharacterized protein n=1 Tax=Synaphobranchus kaupii TaxID=118154 RepID=A0A9Q1IJH6_SYNKA|nr:hypothetical protein SKAU_G00340500 [Synaphobranchus kaupii]